MGDELVPDLVLITHDHDHVAAGHYGVDDMSWTDKSDLNFAGEHRLRRLGGNDENRLYLDIVLAEEPFLLGDPSGRHIGIDRAVSKDRFRRRVCGLGETSAQVKNGQNYSNTNSFSFHRNTLRP